MAPTAPDLRGYHLAMAACSPIVRGWGRLEVTGLDALPASGPTLLMANHDSYWDPIAIGVAALGHRQIRALAKSSMWKIRGLDKILDSMGQIPIDRGKGDVGALERAIADLRAGACIGVFPEGTRSRGKTLRARSGFGRLAEAVPEAQVVSCAVSGTTDIPRFPTRPRVTVHFFAPEGGGLQPGEAHAEFAARLLAQSRALAPIDAAGRRKRAAAG